MSVMPDTVRTVPRSAKVKKPSGQRFPVCNLGLGVKAQVMLVTPKMAEHWLSKRPQVQRNIRHEHLETIVRNIAQDRWVFNAQPIIINARGELADGQHRLQAIIKANKSVYLLVITGLDPSAFDTIDSSRGRAPSDALAASGHKHCTALAGAILLAWKYQHGISFHSGGQRLSPIEVDLWAKDHPEMDKAVISSQRTWKICRSNAGPSFCWWLFWKIDKAACEHFFEKLYSGEDLAKGHPMLELRRKLFEIGSTPDFRTNTNMLLVWMFQTWNAIRTKKPLTLFRPGRDEKPPALV